MEDLDAWVELSGVMVTTFAVVVVAADDVAFVTACSCAGVEDFDVVRVV